MNKKRNPQTEITNKELEEIDNEGEDMNKTAKLKQQQAAFKQTVANTKVPVHGNLRVEEKDEEAIRVLGLNINSLLFWQRRQL